MADLGLKGHWRSQRGPWLLGTEVRRAALLRVAEVGERRRRRGFGAEEADSRKGKGNSRLPFTEGNDVSTSTKTYYHFSLKNTVHDHLNIQIMPKHSYSSFLHFSPTVSYLSLFVQLHVRVIALFIILETKIPIKGQLLLLHIPAPSLYTIATCRCDLNDNRSRSNREPICWFLVG